MAAQEEKEIQQIFDLLNTHFKLEDLGNLHYYLGIEVEINSNGIYEINQSKYKTF